MKSGKAWGAHSMDDDGHKTAGEAGPSLDEQLKRAISERFAAASQGAAPRQDDLELHAITEAVEHLKRRISALDPAFRAVIPGLDERLANIGRHLDHLAATRVETGERARSLKEVSAMVDTLRREVDDADEFARSTIEGRHGRTAEAPRAPSGRAESQKIAQPTEERLAKLDELRDRLDTLLAQGPRVAENASPRAAALGETLKSLETRLDEAKVRLASPPVQQKATPAAEPEQPADEPVPEDEGDPLRRIEERLTEIVGRLDAPDNAQPANPSPEAVAGDLSSAIAEIASRQRVLDQRSEALALRREQKDLSDAVTTLRGDIGKLVDAITSLKREDDEDRESYVALAKRIDGLVGQRPLDRATVGEIRAELESLRTRLDKSTRQATLGQVVSGYRRISQRLDDLFNRIGDTSSLDALGREIVNLRRALETADSAPAVDGLERQVGELTQQVEALLARQQVTVEASDMSERLDEIHHAIDRLGDEAPLMTVVASLNDRLEALSAQIEEIGREPAIAIAGMNRHLSAITQRLDAISANQKEPVLAIAGLREQFGSFSNRLDAIHKAQREPAADVAGLHQRLAWLTRRLDEMNSLQREPIATLEQIKAEVTEIRREIGGRQTVRPDRVERQMSSLAESLKATSEGENDDRALSQLETQVAELAAELERALPRGEALQTVEAKLAQLQNHLSDSRSEFDPGGPQGGARGRHRTCRSDRQPRSRQQCNPRSERGSRQDQARCRRC